MWSTAAGLLLVLTLASGFEGDVFDVTTVYNAVMKCNNDLVNKEVNSGSRQLTIKNEHCKDGTGYVHARTNANGLPLYDGESKYIVSNHSRLNITCDTQDEVCSWDIKDWSFNYTAIDWISMQKNIPYLSNKIQLVKVIKETNRRGHSYLYVTSDNPNISNGRKFIVIQLQDYSDEHFDVNVYTQCDNRCCDTYSPIVIDYDGDELTAYCNIHENFQQIKSRYMQFTISGSYITIYYSSQYDTTSQKQVYYDSNNLDIKYFSITNSTLRVLIPTMLGKALTPSKHGAELVSPLVQSTSGQICLVLVLHSEAYVSGDLLQILSRDLSQRDQLLHIVSDVKAGWSVKQLYITLHKDPLQQYITTLEYKVRLVVKKIGSQPLLINYISSCNPEGRDVLPVEYITYLPRYSPTPYTVSSKALGNVRKDLETQSYCKNGGVMTSAGCACPAGFYGPLCCHGCGKNRFGMDCGGRCSMWNEECEGLKLCTFFTGCHCAPGYTGLSCKDKCSLGFYGNDCSQQCGACESASACDIYTGMCESCAPGQVPPYCKEVYPYYSSAPIIASDTYGLIEVKINYNASHMHGVGTPKLYQLQYREKGDSIWEIHSTKFFSVSEEVSKAKKILEAGTIKDLNHGVAYQVRIVLMDDNFNKYDGDLVPISEVVAKCYIPDAYDYGVKSTSEPTSITFSWSYQNKSEEWCPTETYEVSWKTDWQWITRFTKESLSLKDLLPGTVVEFKVRTKTIAGFAPFSNIVHASTSGSESAAVVDLHKVSAQSSSALVSWQPPLGSKKQSLQFTIAYKCVDRVACSPGCDNAPEETLTQEDTNVTLSPLLPFTKYLITVTPEHGLGSSIYIGTSESLPTERPQLSSVRPVRTNTSVTVFWDEEPICSGFLQGYNYQLTKTSDRLKILASGFTEGKEKTFTNLTASTEYQVKVFVVTVAGWNPDYYLMINVSTSASVPEAVQNLTIYKRSRHMLGLRWAEPRATYGKIKSFTVTHSLGQSLTSHVIEPTRCVPWPHLYCHTIEGLKSNRKYNVTVSARNMDVEDNGDVAYLTGFTKETSPAAPENLKLLNSSSTSVGLEWGYPSLANGMVRSFLVNVEETEQNDQDNCCQVFPILETPVQEEQEAYRVEISGLHPASTYYVSVTAKTVALGPSQPLVVYTRPPHLPITLLPSEDTLKELTLSEGPLTWSSSDQGPEVNNSDVYSSLVQGYIILAVLNTSAGEVVSGVANPALHSLIREHISRPFYFVAEYNEEGVVSSSAWGQPPCPLPSSVTLAVAQITEYNRVYNVNVRFSNSSVTFTDCF